MGATGWPDARRPQQSGGLCKLSWSIRSPPDPEVQISPPPGTRVGTPSVRRLRLEHDDLGFLEEAARLLGFQVRRLVLETAIGPVLALPDGKEREARWD